MYKISILIIIGSFYTMNASHTLFITFKAKIGNEAALRKELEAVPVLVANVKELLRLEIAENILAPGSFILYEEWTDENARLEHSEEQYVIDFFERIDPLLAEPHHYMVGVLKNGDEE